jgi:hypothetical protein
MCSSGLCCTEIADSSILSSWREDNGEGNNLPFGKVGFDSIM